MSVRKIAADTELKVHANDANIKDAEDRIEKVESANLAMLTNIRQGAQIGIFTIQAIGIALDQTITLLVEAVFLSIEVAAEIQALLVGATSGVSAVVSTLLKGATVVSMGFLIYQLKHKQAESARRTSGIVSGLRMASFR